MTEVLFYHLQNSPLGQTLPKLLEASLKREWRVVVKLGDASALEPLSADLWTYRADSFLPHGTNEDGPADQQPIFLTTGDDNPNSAQVLFLVHGATPGPLDAYSRCVLMFDGGDDEALNAARGQWKELKAAGHEATYWQQNENGGWEKKA